MTITVDFIDGVDGKEANINIKAKVNIIEGDVHAAKNEIKRILKGIESGEVLPMINVGKIQNTKEHFSIMDSKAHRTVELKTEPCKKCGHTSATIEYVPDEYRTIHTCAGGGKAEKIKDNDYINATCDRCWHTWRVDPLDKEK